MTNNIIEKRINTLNNFRNFCAFVASNHNIHIYTQKEFQASAQENAIFVPDVSNLTEKQILFVYSCVLHEVGHIKHTSFDKKYFSKLFNQTIAFIANVLEDAREESLLCDEFLGAKDIFQETGEMLITREPEIAEILEFNVEDIGFFKCFTLWLYYFSHRSISIDMEVFEKNMPPEVMKEVNHFLKETDFVKKFSDLKTKLVTQKDTLAYSNKIYDLLSLKYSPEKIEISLSQMVKAKEELVKNFDKLKENVQKHLEIINKEKIDLLNKNAESIRVLQKIKNENNENEKAVQAESKAISDNNNKIQEYKTYMNMDGIINCNIEQVEKTSNEVKERQEKLKEIQEKQNALSAEIIELSNQLDSLEGIPKNEKKRANLEKRINSRKESIAKASSRLEKTNILIEKRQESIEKNKNYKDFFTEKKKNIQKSLKELKGKTNDEIQLSIEEIEKNTQKTNKSLAIKIEKQNLYMQPHHNILEEIQDINSNIDFHNYINSRRIYQSIMNMTELVIKNHLGNRILPNMSMQSQWPEMAKFQKEQDLVMSKEAGIIIVDGINFCETEEDIDWLFSAIENHIASIDPLIQFKKLVAPCFKDTVTIMSHDIEYIFDKNKVIPMEHNVFSKKFDKIEDKNKIDPIEDIDFKLLCKKHEEKIDAIAETLIHTLQPKKQQRWISNRRNGFLDNRNLWKYASGEDRIFKQNETSYNQPTSVSIVLDLSSSNYFGHTSIEDMKIFTKGVSDALMDLDIEHEIIGYYAQFSPELKMESINSNHNRKNHQLMTSVFKKFTDNNNLGIGNIKMHLADNSDGESLKLAVQRLSQQAGNKKIVLMVSDFMPHMYSANTHLLIKDFQNSVKFAKTQNTKIYGLNTRSVEMSNVVDEFPMFCINGLSQKSIAQLEEEQFFDFVSSIKQ